MALEVTKKCNLACSYCYFREGQENKNQSMSFETAKKALSYFAPDSDINVSFFGGDPLLNFDLIEKVTLYVEALAKQRKVNCSFHVTTNGMLLDKDIVDFMRKHNFTLIISLDGDESVHNKNRPAKGRHINSHSKTLEGLHLLSSGNMSNRTTLRGTFVGSDVNVVERLEYLNKLCDEGFARNVSFEPASLTESTCLEFSGNYQSASEKDFVNLRKSYGEVSQWYVDRIKRDLKARFKHYQVILKRLLYRKHSACECGAGVGYAAIDTKGYIYACHRQGRSKIGHVDFGFNESLTEPWIDNRLYLRRGCVDCWARYLCGGGCRYDSLKRGRGINDPDVFGCFIKRTLCEEILWIEKKLGADKLCKLIFP